MPLLAFFFHGDDGNGLALYCFVGICGGLYLCYRGFRLLQRRHLILDTPFSKIRSASMGVIEVSGLAVGPYTMVAPITSMPCYYYRTQVWEYKQQGRNKRWVKVAAECMHLPFFLDDNTGRVLVDPRQAELDLHRDFHQEFCDSFFTTKEPPPENVRGFLARHGIVTSNKVKVEEYCIKPKNALFILGTLGENLGIDVAPKPVPDTDTSDSVAALSRFSLNIGVSSLFSSFNTDTDEDTRLGVRFAAMTATAAAPAPEVVRLSSPDSPALSTAMTQQQKIAAAMMKAGITNPAAWAVAGLSGGTAVNGNYIAAQAKLRPDYDGLADSKFEPFPQHPPVVLTKGDNNKAFMISWRSQRDVARSLGWKCAAMIWGGPGLSLLCLYLLLRVLHI